MALTDRIASWITPPEPMTSDHQLTWSPPALSAAATAPAQQRTSQAARNTPIAESWQDRAWSYYRSSGPARQAVDWLANGVSRMHLYVGQTQPEDAGDPEPVDEPGLAGEILDELYDGQTGQRDMLHKLAIGLSVPGEAWLIGYPAPPKPGEPDTGLGQDNGTAWMVASRREWSTSSTQEGTVRLKVPRHPELDRDGFVTFALEQVVIVPIWQPDPEDSTKSTSRFEAAMKDLDELDGLSRRTAADIKSRLAGAGLVAVPESATMPEPGMSEADGSNPLHGNPLIHGLMDAASRAIQDPDSPSALIPIFTQFADEAIGKIQHLDFSTQFDSQVPVLRDAARKAVAAALDVPSTVVTGVEELSHWTVWSIEDSAIVTHLGPLASLICTTITREILWPALRAAGTPDPEQLVIWWDASELQLRPDRSTEALNAFKEGIISGDAARRELGFAAADRPSEQERQEQMARKQQQQRGQPGGGMQQPQGGQPSPSDRPEPPAGPETAQDSAPAF